MRWSFKNPFKRTPKGGKGASMAEATATPPIDMAALTKAVGELVSAEVTKALKQVTDSVASLGIQVADLKKAPEARKDEPLTLEKVLGEVKGAVLSEVKTLLTSNQQSQQQADARKAYIKAKMEKVPEIYHGLLGNDPAKWPAEEQAARERLKVDLAAQGVKPEPVGGDKTGGLSPAAVTDLSKIDPMGELEAAVVTSHAKLAPPTTAPTTEAAK
jgi:hypothetical protein